MSHADNIEILKKRMQDVRQAIDRFLEGGGVIPRQQTAAEARP